MKVLKLISNVIRCILIFLFTDICDNKTTLDKDISRCVVDISNRYFQTDGPIVVQTYTGWWNYILNERNYTPVFEIQDTLLDLLFTTGHNSIIIVGQIKHSMYFTFTTVKRTSYIFTLDCGSIELQYHMLYKYMSRIRLDLRSRAARLIIVSTYVFLSRKDQEKYARTLLNYAWIGMLNENAIILLPEVCSSYKNCRLLRFNVFSLSLNKQSNLCSKLLDHVPMLDTWDSTKKEFLANNNLFPHQKIRNMNNCTLEIFASHWSPFLLIDYTRNKSIYGPIAELLKTMAEYINFQMEITFDPNELKPDSYPYDIVGPVMLTKFVNFQVGQVVNSYFIDELSIYVPAGAQIPKWRSLIKTFTSELWTLVAVTYLFGVFMFWIMLKPVSHTIAHRSHSSYIDALMNAMGSCLSMAITFNHTGISIRLFFVFWLFYCLIINTAYQSTLFSFLLNPGHSKPIRSLQELEESGIPKGRAVHFLYNNIIELNISDFNDCINSDCLERVSKNRDLALLGGKTITDLIISSAYTQKGKPLIVPITDWCHKAYLTLDIYCGNSFTKHLEFIVHTLKSTGIIDKWIEDGFIKLKNNYRTDLNEGVATALNLTHIQGPFYILLIGLTLAFLSFMVEKVIFLYFHCE